MMGLSLNHSLVSNQKVSHVKGLPKAKFGNCHGKPPEYRLGSVRAHVQGFPTTAFERNVVYGEHETV